MTSQTAAFGGTSTGHPNPVSSTSVAGEFEPLFAPATSSTSVAGEPLFTPATGPIVTGLGYAATSGPMGSLFTPAISPTNPGFGYAATSGAMGFQYTASHAPSMSFNEAPIHQHRNSSVATLHEGIPRSSQFSFPTSLDTTTGPAIHDSVSRHTVRSGSANTSHSLRNLGPCSPSSSRLFASSGIKTPSIMDSPRAATPYDRPLNPSPQGTLPKQFIEDTKAHLGLHFITKAHPLADQSSKNKACREAFNQAKHYWPAYSEIIFVFIVFLFC